MRCDVMCHAMSCVVISTLYTENHAKIAMSFAYQKEKHLAAQPVRPLVEAGMDCHWTVMEWTAPNNLFSKRGSINSINPVVP